MSTINYTEAIIIINTKELPDKRINYENVRKQLNEESFEIILSGNDFTIYGGINHNLGKLEQILYFKDKILIE
jgi:hypothetical protein